jgi:hypothetical protein
MTKKRAKGERKALSVRTRFEVFKRDDFTCCYCGRKSPDVVLEIDHILPIAKGGTDDPMNLQTACWDCNHGKSDVPLESVVTAEDPHDKAILILERERQLAEYNRVVAEERDRRESECWELWQYWVEETGNATLKRDSMAKTDFHWLMGVLRYCPKEVVRGFMDAAIAKWATKNLKYVGACVRNWRYEHMASQPDEE